MTILVNLFAGPGAGKSTMMSGVFNAIKHEAFATPEMAPEFAKELTWEKNHKALGCQMYVAGNQLYRIRRLVGNVDIIITDSPILLATMFTDMSEPKLMGAFLEAHYLLMQSCASTLNVFIERVKPYNPLGRNQTESHAREIDIDILKVIKNAARDATEEPMHIRGDESGCKALVTTIREMHNA